MKAQDKPPPPDPQAAEARRLGASLATTDAAERKPILEKLRDGKGEVYTSRRWPPPSPGSTINPVRRCAKR